MEEQPALARKEDESMATDNFHSAIDDSKFVPQDIEEVKETTISPAKVEKAATIEDDWIKLRT